MRYMLGDIYHGGIRWYELDAGGKRISYACTRVEPL